MPRLEVILARHQDSAAGGDLSVEAMAWRPAPGDLSLIFLVEGNLSDVVWPAWTEPKRGGELWRSTCLEAFVSAGQGYLELNFAPSQQWAAYVFDGYRSGMADAPLTLFHSPRAIRSDRAATLETEMLDMPGLSPTATWRLGLTAVIEHTSGDRSYWSARHPPGKPDFHHPDSFVLELPPP